MAIGYVGDAEAAATSATLPAFTAGDLAIVFAYRNGSNTAPSLPAGWTNYFSGGANTNSFRVGYRILVGGDTTTGVWTNATNIAVLVVNGHTSVNPLGGANFAGTNTSTLTSPAMVMQRTFGDSWVALFAGSKATNANGVTYTGTTDEASTDGHLNVATGRNVSSWAGGNYSATVNANGNEIAVVEILVDTSYGRVTQAGVEVAYTPVTPDALVTQTLVEVAYIRGTTASITADAVRLKTASGSLTSDSVLVLGAVAGSFTADAVLLKTQPGSFTADGVLKRTQTGSLTADAVLKRTQSASLTADAFIQPYFTADAVITAGTAEASFTANAVLLRNQAGSFAANAVLHRAQARSFSGDAFVQPFFRADAVLLVPHAFAANAVLKKSQTGSLTADAIRKKTGTSSSFSANAFFKRVVSSSKTANAVLKRTGSTRSLSSNAYITLTRLRHDRATSHTGLDSSVDHTLAGVIEIYPTDWDLMDVLISVDARLTAREAGRWFREHRFTADAVRFRSALGALLADGRLMPRLSADAFIALFLRANSVLRAVRLASFQADSSFDPMHFRAKAWIVDPAIYLSDSIAGAVDWGIRIGNQGAFIATTALSDEPGDPIDWWGSPIDQTAWAKFTLTQPTQVQLTTEYTGADSLIVLYGPGSPTEGNWINSGDDNIDPNPAFLDDDSVYDRAEFISSVADWGGENLDQLPILVAGTYYVEVVPYDGGDGPYDFNIVLNMQVIPHVSANAIVKAEIVGPYWTQRPNSFSGGIFDVAYGNGSWVAVGQDGQLATATDPAGTWTQQVTPFSPLYGIFGVAYASGTWVGVALDGLIATAISPTDGWTANVTGNWGLVDVAFGVDMWVGVGYNGNIATASDAWGVWTLHGTTALGFNIIQAVAYGNGVWVAVAEHGKLATATDPEGTWTLNSALFGAYPFRDVAFANGIWVVVGGNGQIITATDPTGTWTLRRSTFDIDVLNSVMYDGNVWMAAGTAGQILTATDPTGTWNRLGNSSFDSDHEIFAIAYGEDGSSVAVGTLGTIASYHLFTADAVIV